MSNQAFSDMAMQRILRADQARSSDTASFAASGESPGGAPGASSRLKSRIYSRLIELEQQQGPLRVLAASRAAGEKLCIFEAGLALLPGEQLQSRYIMRDPIVRIELR
ncbi:MAG: hypothetical protein EXQ56_13745 [Acidobacteria bacterium]|nr:hypothetical protein [Acidobacteriota bacterium]